MFKTNLNLSWSLADSALSLVSVCHSGVRTEVHMVVQTVERLFTINVSLLPTLPRAGGDRCLKIQVPHMFALWMKQHIFNTGSM